MAVVLGVRSFRIGIGAEDGDGRVDANQISADRIVQALPVGLRWPRGIGRAATTESASGRSGISEEAARQHRQQRRRSDCFQECSSVHWIRVFRILHATADITMRVRTRSLTRISIISRRIAKELQREKDSMAEGSEFEPPVPVSKLSDDNVML